MRGQYKDRRNRPGKFIYLEWLNPCMDYYQQIRLNEVVFEILIPAAAGIAADVIYCKMGRVSLAAARLADILLTLTSILIGISIMLVTLLLTSGGSGMDVLKTRQIRGKQGITLFRSLHINFVNSLISEIFLMIFILFYYFVRGLCGEGPWEAVILPVFVYMILHILLLLLRGITNVYFSYYKEDTAVEKKK